MRYCPTCKTQTLQRACPFDGAATVGIGAGSPDPLVGRIIEERYQLEEVIGRGGMGTVYRARQIRMDRDVAVKLLRPDLVASRSATGRFQREARVASLLKHPNSIVTYDFGASKVGFYLVMELLSGETLHERIGRLGQLEPMEAARIGACVAASLAEAREKGVVHRDLKPSNVFLHRVRDMEVVKVLDFGIAKFVHQALSDSLETPDAAERSSRGNILYQTTVLEGPKRTAVGTAHYIAPEQLLGDAIDGRADIYALGALLYTMLTGRPPFEGPPDEVLKMHLEAPRPVLPDAIPEPLRVLITVMLARDRDRRPRNTDEVAMSLRHLVGGGSLVGVARDPADTGFPRPRRKNRRPPAAAPPVVLADPRLEVDMGTGEEDLVRSAKPPAPTGLERAREDARAAARPGLAAQSRGAQPGGLPTTVAKSRGSEPGRLPIAGAKSRGSKPGRLPIAAVDLEEARRGQARLGDPGPRASGGGRGALYRVAMAMVAVLLSAGVVVMMMRHSNPTGREGTQTDAQRRVNAEGVGVATDHRDWVRIGPGAARIGSGEEVVGRLPSEGPVHDIALTHAIWAKQTEVTQREWAQVMETRPWADTACGERCPVESVTWWSALAFCNALSRGEGRPLCYGLHDCEGRPGQGFQCKTVAFSGVDCGGYRLPTEAEWEHVARAVALGSYGEARGPHRRELAPVGVGVPNAWGMHDMLGNVSEWVWDRFSAHFYARSPKTDPTGPETGGRRSRRGCSFRDIEVACRPAARFSSLPFERSAAIGFRPVLTLD